jgi:hypothetical protein
MSDDDPSKQAIRPEELDQILARDLENIVAKAKAGKVLSSRERSIIEDARNGEQLESNDGFRLTGEMDGPLSGLTVAELSKRWGYSLRQLKNWLADGKKAKDPAPVRQPTQMAAWFSRVYHPRQCPDRLLQAAQRLAREGSEKPTSSNTPQLKQKLEVGDAEKGQLAMLDRLRESEVLLHRKYLASVEDDEHKASFLFGEWTNTVEKLRALEKSAPKALEEAGIYVRRDDVKRELAPLHASIIKAFKQALRKGRVVLKATHSPEEWNDMADGLVDETCKMLSETSFAEPLELLTS